MENKIREIILNCEKMERRFALMCGGKLEEYKLHKNLLKINKKSVFYTQTKQGIEDVLRQEKSVEFVLFLGAGDIYDIAKSFLDKN